MQVDLVEDELPACRPAASLRDRKRDLCRGERRQASRHGPGNAVLGATDDVLARAHARRRGTGIRWERGIEPFYNPYSLTSIHHTLD